MLKGSTDRITLSLNNYTETVDKILNLLTEMDTRLDKQAEETETLKSMLFRLEQLLDTMSDENV